MGRRHTAGAVGNQGVGGVQVDNTTISAADNQDITIDPSGTGIFRIAGDAQLQAQGDLRFADADSSNYVAFQAPSTVASNVTWTLPATDGTNGQSIVTNGSGTLSWATTQAAITDNTSDSATNYVSFTTLTTGSLTAVRVSTTKLTFQPSTGLFTTTELTVNGTARSLRTENTTSISKTLQLADQDKVVACTNSTSITITVPADGTVNFPIGSVVYIGRFGVGGVTLAAGAGCSLSRTGQLASNEEMFVRKRAANTWVTVESSTPLTTTGGTLSTSGAFTIRTFTSSGAGTLGVS